MASRGILSGAILAIGRSAEDTAVILLTGVVAQAGIPRGLVDKFEALPFRIYCLAAEHRNREQLDQGFGTALILVSITVALFLFAMILQRLADRVYVLREGRMVQEMDRRHLQDLETFQGLIEAAF